MTLIFVDKIIFKQNPVQRPISLPPIKTNFFGKISVGKNAIEIKIIPEKKIVENVKFLNIIINLILVQIAFVFF